MYIFYKFSLRSLVAQGRFYSGWRLRPFCHVRNVSFSGVPQAVTRFFATSLDKWEPSIQLPPPTKFRVFDKKVHSFQQSKNLHKMLKITFCTIFTVQKKGAHLFRSAQCNLTKMKRLQVKLQSDVIEYIIY